MTASPAGSHSLPPLSQGTSALPTLQLWEKATPKTPDHPNPGTETRWRFTVWLCYRFLKTETKQDGQRGKDGKRTKITLSQHSAPRRNNTSGLNKSLKPVSSQFHLIMPFAPKLGSQQTTDRGTPPSPILRRPPPTPSQSPQGKQKGRKNS